MTSDKNQEKYLQSLCLVQFTTITITIFLSISNTFLHHRPSSWIRNLPSSSWYMNVRASSWYTIIVWHASLSHSLTPSITPSLSPKLYSITDKNHHHHRIATCTRDLKSTVVVIIDSPVSYRSFHWIVHARQCTVSGCLTISLLMLCPTRVSVIMGFIAASRRHVVTRHIIWCVSNETAE